MKKYLSYITVFSALALLLACTGENVGPRYVLEGTYDARFTGSYVYKGKEYLYEHFPRLHIGPGNYGDYEMSSYDQQGQPIEATFTPVWHEYQDSVYFGNYYYFSNTGSLQSGRMEGVYNSRYHTITGVFLASAFIELPKVDGGGIIEVPVEGSFIMERN